MRKGWKEVKIAEYYTISSGLSKSADQFGSGFPFVSFKDVFWNYFLPDELKELVNTTELEQKKCSVKKGDVFLTRTSESVEELGMSCVALKDYPTATFNGFTKRLRPISNEIDPVFIGFYLRSLQFRAEITAYSSLTTRASLNNSIINRLRIKLPPLPTQRKIAGILSAYDDLIENNLKRIKLLEEKAQLIYEEWFVRMKFPGHETTPINEETGLPEGWEEKPLGEYCKILKGKNITKSTINEGNIPVVAGGLLPAYYHDTSNTISPVITVSASGANAGFTNIYLNDIWASDCSYIDSTMTKYLFFIYALMIHNQQKIYHFQKGAAQPHVYPKDLARLESIIPTENLQQKFNDISKDIFSSIRNQRNQNQLLKEARDILLPRLMTGMIDVDKIKGVV